MLTLITNRKQSDVDRAKQLIEKAKVIESLSSSELTEYLSGLKGCYNVVDLNRVEEAVEYISHMLNVRGYYNIVETKSWKDGDFFQVSKIPRYLDNIKRIRNAIARNSSVPAVPSSYKPFNNANDIEKILLEIHKTVINVENNYIHAGVSRCGQPRVWQQRFRRSQIWDSFNLSIAAYNKEVQYLSVTNLSASAKTTSNIKLKMLDGNENLYANLVNYNSNLNIIDNKTGEV